MVVSVLISKKNRYQIQQYQTSKIQQWRKLHHSSMKKVQTNHTNTQLQCSSEGWNATQDYRVQLMVIQLYTQNKNEMLGMSIRNKSMSKPWIEMQIVSSNNTRDYRETKCMKKASKFNSEANQTIMQPTRVIQVRQILCATTAETSLIQVMAEVTQKSISRNSN